jgi:GNAT superfamily N-acetyltransferase
MSYKIRIAKPNDADIIVRFQLEMAMETENLELDKKTVMAGVDTVFAADNIGRYYIIEYEGEIVASLLTLYEWSDWRNGSVIWIHSVYVLPNHRRKGMFKMMYTHLKEMVQEADHLKGLRLYVDKKNVLAHQVYETVGMTKEHYELFEWLKDY